MTPTPDLRASVREMAKPCPFCGEQRVVPETIPVQRDAPWRAWLMCMACRATGPAAEGPFGELDAVLRAVTAWNRAPPPLTARPLTTDDLDAIRVVVREEMREEMRAELERAANGAPMPRGRRRPRPPVTLTPADLEAAAERHARRGVPSKAR